jgi:hypothetical protein
VCKYRRPAIRRCTKNFWDLGRSLWSESYSVWHALMAPAVTRGRILHIDDCSVTDPACAFLRHRPPRKKKVQRALPRPFLFKAHYALAPPHAIGRKNHLSMLGVSLPKQMLCVPLAAPFVLGGRISLSAFSCQLAPVCPMQPAPPAAEERAKCYHAHCRNLHRACSTCQTFPEATRLLSFVVLMPTSACSRGRPAAMPPIFASWPPGLFASLPLCFSAPLPPCLLAFCL